MGSVEAGAHRPCACIEARRSVNLREMSYRETPSSHALITYLAGTLLALDPEHGTKRWERPLGDVNPGRVVVAGQTVFVATRELESGDPSLVFAFDLLTGADRAKYDAGFPVRTALVIGDRVYFGGQRGMLALRADGTVLFHATAQVMTESAWSGNTYDLVMKNGAGQESWRLAKIASVMQLDGLMASTEGAAQPDFEG